MTSDPTMTGPVLLAIDTATTRIVVGLGALDGGTIARLTWEAGYRHGETLLPAIERLLADANVDRRRIAGIVVGTGPGAFTGLRVGLATAKGLAHGLGVPIVGVSTGDALLGAIARGVGAADEADQGARDADGAGSIDQWALLLPAGPSDQLLVRHAAPSVVLPAGVVPELGAGVRLAAIDLEGRAPDDAVAIGERHRDALADELLRIGAGRVAAGDADDLARLVPEYVTLPRGAVTGSGEVTWSHDRP